MVSNQTFGVAVFSNVKYPAVIVMATLMPADIIWLPDYSINHFLSPVQRLSTS
jgi:hypothetical protein